MNIRTTLLLAALMWLWLPAGAQTQGEPGYHYAMGYLRGHHFVRQGGDFNVIDTDIEWPEILGGAHPEALQRYISGSVLGTVSCDADSAYAAFVSGYGRLVSGQLDSLPDDRRFCYVTAAARVRTYSPGRWICYELTLHTEPGSLSPVERRHEVRYVVYDMRCGRVLRPDDLLRANVLQGGSVSVEFVERLYAQLSAEQMEQLVSTSIDGMWIEPDGQAVGLKVTCGVADRLMSYEVAMPYAYVRGLMHREARRLVEDAEPTVPLGQAVLPPAVGRDTIYNNVVDSMPRYPGGREAMARYMASFPAPSQAHTGRVQLSFATDTTGQVSHVYVVGPLSPDIDRHAARLVGSMPRFVPGRHQGRPVWVRNAISLYFRE